MPNVILGIDDYWRIFYLVIVWSINQFNTLWSGLQVSEFLHKGFTRAGLDVDFVWNSGWVTNKKCCNKLIFKLIFEIDLFLYNSRILYKLSIEEELLNEFFLGSSILNSKNSSWYCYHDKNRLKNEQCQLKLQLSFIKKIEKRGYRLFWPLDSKNWISIFWHHTVPKSCIEVNLIFLVKI